MEDERRAALRLQRFWRKYLGRTTQQLTQMMVAAGLTIDNVQFMQFDVMSNFFKEAPFIDLVGTFLRRIYKLCTILHGPQGGDDVTVLQHVTVVKSIIAAYMIAYHTNRVFANMGPFERGLLASAKDITQSIQALSDALCVPTYRGFVGVPNDITTQFRTKLFEYLKCFKDWQEQDLPKLIRGIRQALTGLYQTFPPPGEPEVCRVYLAQIEKLRSKLRELGGTQALDDFDNERLHWALPGQQFARAI